MLKRIVASCAVLVLAAGLAASPASAKNPCSPGKNGTKGCKNEIKNCVTTDCAGMTGKDLKKCKHTSKKPCKTSVVAACQASNTVCSGSPSGSFVD